MPRFGRFFKIVFFVAVLHSHFSGALAEDSVLVSISEERTMAKALDIVEGKVLAQSISKQKRSDSCFSYLYSLKVEKSYKQKIKKGDTLNVGLNLRSLEVEADQNHLIVLTELPNNYFDFCDRGDSDSFSDIKITYGYMVGVVEIYKNDNGTKKYRGISCNPNKPVMYEHASSEMKKLTDSCYQVTGEYSDLENRINVDLSSK